MAQTWADIVARGSGTAEFRLQIEGVVEQFVTAGMAIGVSGAYERIGGLEREGLGFEETCYLAGAEQKVSIQPIQIADEGIGPNRGRATRLFSTIARAIDYLQADLDDVTTNFGVRDSAAVAGRYVWMGTETIFVDTALTGTTVDTSRAQLGSSGQYHYVRTGARPSVTPIYDHPPGFVSRRVWLYAHGPGETGLGDAGTCVWRGIIGKEPSESGGVWTLQVEPRTKILDGTIAAGFDAFKLRGIYYPGVCPLIVTVIRSSGATADLTSTDSVTIYLSGFWENQSDFCSDLTATLNASSTIAAWGVSFEARTVPEDGGWDLYVRTATGTARHIAVLGGSPIDGLFKGTLLGEFDALSRGASAGTEGDVGYDVVSVTADTVYRVQRHPGLEGVPTIFAGMVEAKDLRQVPRGNYGAFARIDRSGDDATYPHGRLYLTSVSALTTSDSLSLMPLGEDATPQTLSILNVDTANGAVTAYVAGEPDAYPLAMSAGQAQPTITGLQTYASGDGSLADFMANLIFRAPALANRATSPHVIDDDVASWATGVAEAAGGAAWALRRNYSFGKGLRAIEVLKEEWKLLGLIPYLDADFKLSVRPLTFETREPDYEIESEHRIIDDGFGTVSGDDDGLVTAVKIVVGYDPVEDKNAGDTFDIRDLGAIARVKREARLEIEPKSNAVGAELTWEDAESRAMTVTTIFGARRTHTVEFDVSLALFNMKIGDALAVTIPQLPGDGKRGIWDAGQGITSRTGYLISRSWDLSSGRGRVRVLLHELAIAGYTPSGHITGATGASTVWTLNLDPGRYSGTNDAGFFTVGDRIRIHEFDVASPTTISGTIDAVDTAGEKVEVTLDSAWGGLAGSEYLLMYDTAGAVSAAQRRRCYLADGTNGLINGSESAYTLSP